MIETIKTGISYGLTGIGAFGTFIIGLLLIGVLANAVEAVSRLISNAGKPKGGKPDA